MRILVAEDDRVSRQILTTALGRWGFDLTVTTDGAQAWEELRKEDAPHMAILDWMMPEIDGVELTRRSRALHRPSPTYITLLTARVDKNSVIAGLEAGANDYLTKPVDLNELRARVRVAGQMVDLQLELAARVVDLEKALSEVRRLEGLLPICAYCKKVRDEADYWMEVEDYVGAHTNCSFSHGVCPQCLEAVKAEFRVA